MGASVIIAAAGSASRMKGTDKILCKVNGREILSYSLLAFDKAECADKIVVVTAQEKIDKIRKIVSSLSLKTETEVVCGGKTRQESVYNALKYCDEKSDAVMIHDGARPMIDKKTIKELYEQIAKNNKKGAAVGVKVKDTIKVVSSDGEILSTPDRESLVAIQTPQCFEFSLYKKAYDKAIKEGKDYTDDSQLFEAIGEKVYVLYGDYKNIKITTPDDLAYAEIFLKEREND